MPKNSNPYPNADPEKNCFVMMRYRERDEFKQIEAIIRATLKKHGVAAGLAKDRAQALLLWSNVRTYMDHARFGIAIFDNIACYSSGESRDNPNICMELGYMQARKADCLILRDTGGAGPVKMELFTDLRGHIVQDFNSDKLERLEQIISDWIRQRIEIAPIFDGFAQMFPDSKIAQRIKQQPQEKLKIARALVERWIRDDEVPRSLLLDSGTTAAAVAEVIMLNVPHFKKTRFYTNNLLVSLMLSSAASLHCHVLPGVVDDSFACVFTNPPHSAFQEHKIDIAVISCTGFCSKKGPLVNSENNRLFKLAAITQCTCSYLIFGSDKLTAKDAGDPVFCKVTDWQQALRDGKIARVITDQCDIEKRRPVKDALKSIFTVID